MRPPPTTLSKAGLWRMSQRRVAAYYAAPKEVVIQRGKGVFLWDMDGSRYFDMLAGFGSVSLGHAHPGMVEAITEQAGRLAMTSRSILNDVLPQTAEVVCSLLGYDQFLPSSSGVEACETAVKLARRWGYRCKGVEQNRARILLLRGCFWGRSVTACGGSSDPLRSHQFGPTTPGFDLVPYDDPSAVERYLVSTPDCVAVMVEPIQGEGGTVVPRDGYLARLRDLTLRHDALLICDEVQTGLGRTGKLMGYHHDIPHHDAKPDIVVLGKALSAGYSPVSGVVADDRVMGLLGLGEHGSTFGGSPLGMAVARRALGLMLEEGVVANAEQVGAQMRARLKGIADEDARRRGAPPFHVRGRGLMNAVAVDPGILDPEQFCERLRVRGILTRVGGGGVIRFTPPLIISPNEAEEACERVEAAVLDCRRDD